MKRRSWAEQLSGLERSGAERSGDRPAFRMPASLELKRATLSIVNGPADSCFLLSVIAFLYPLPGGSSYHYRKKQAKSYERYFSQLNTQGLQLPVSCSNSEISRFEAMNNNRFAIHILGCEHLGEKRWNFYKLRTPQKDDNTAAVPQIPLLLITDEQTSRNHFVLVTDLSRLLSKANSKRGHKMHFCLRCLKGLSSAPLLEQHQKVCSSNGRQKLIYPDGKNDSHMYFKNHEFSFPQPYIIVGDSEAFFQNTQGPSYEMLGPGGEKPIYSWVKTKIEQAHVKVCKGKCSEAKGCDFILQNTVPQAHLECLSYSYKILSFENRESFPQRFYVGSDVKLNFLLRLRSDLTLLQERLMQNVPMSLTLEEQEAANKATHCHICLKELIANDSRLKGVRNHCHLSGAFFGVAHNICNFKWKAR